MKRPIYEYHCESIAGNFHDVVRYVNDVMAPQGWKLVTAERVGHNVIFILERQVQ